jgi:hypothetical protein
MPINPFVNLGNLIKATATGFIQSVIGTKDTKQPTKSWEIAATTHGHESTSNDNVALSEEAVEQTATTRQEESPQLQSFQTPVQRGEQQTGFVQEKNLFSSRGVQAQESQKGEPSRDASPLAQPAVPEPFPQNLSVGERPATVELQRLLQGWLQLDPKTIIGLERFLEVEFSHYPEDYQIFLNMRMMKMLKQARLLMEEQKLFSAENDQTSTETADGAKRAMIGAALMGYAYYKVLRKRARISDRFGLGVGSKGVAGANQGKEKGPFTSLQEAEYFLKEAEKELHRAMMQGLDNAQIRQIAEHVLYICAQIAELQVNSLSSTQEVAWKAKQPVR